MSLQEPVSSAKAGSRSGPWKRWGITALALIGGLGACAVALLVTLFLVRLSYQNFRVEGVTK